MSSFAQSQNNVFHLDKINSLTTLKQGKLAEGSKSTIVAFKEIIICSYYKNNAMSKCD